jgi:hypothetical protein
MTDKKEFFTTSHFKEVGLIKLWLESEAFEDSGVPQHIAKIANAVVAPLIESLETCQNCVVDLEKQNHALIEENERLRLDVAHLKRAGSPYWSERDATNGVILENQKLRALLDKKEGDWIKAYDRGNQFRALLEEIEGYLHFNIDALSGDDIIGDKRFTKRFNEITSKIDAALGEKL